MILSENVLLGIFDFYENTMNRSCKCKTSIACEGWQMLVCMCQWWRNLIFFITKSPESATSMHPKHPPGTDWTFGQPCLSLVAIDLMIWHRQCHCSTWAGQSCMSSPPLGFAIETPIGKWTRNFIYDFIFFMLSLMYYSQMDKSSIVHLQMYVLFHMMHLRYEKWMTSCHQCHRTFFHTFSSLSSRNKALGQSKSLRFHSFSCPYFNSTNGKLP